MASTVLVDRLGITTSGIDCPAKLGFWGRKKQARRNSISDERHAELMLMGQNSHDDFLRSLNKRISKLERQYLERDIREIEELTNV